MKQIPLKKNFLLNSLLTITFVVALFFVLTITFASGTNSSEPNQLLNSPFTSTQLTSTTTSAQGYQNNQAPFLVRKPFAETYQNSLWVNSFFDHMLPVYTVEGSSLIPSDLRDSNGIIVTTFLGNDITHGNTCVYGVNCYSGHDAIDYNLNSQEVIAPANGVIRVGRESGTCRVWIEHDASSPLDTTEDFSTQYAHLSRIGIASEEQRSRPNRDSTWSNWVEGDLIRAGEVIGISGNDPCGGIVSGSGGGYHLHFGVSNGTASNGDNASIFDPFGWWSNDPDPWSDSRLADIESLDSSPTRSLWTWAAPEIPNPGDPDYWGDDILAQTDDTDASFHKFGPYTRWDNWNVISSDSVSQPVGTGAWRSTSIAQEQGTVFKNWAAWGLHVPASGQYRIQAFYPDLPAPHTPTTNAEYTIYIPTGDTTYSIWTSKPINQNDNNEWISIVDANDNDVFDLLADTVVLVTLDDVTGTAGEAVIFDAVRLQQVNTEPPSPLVYARPVGFTVDNTTSMRGLGKMDALKSALIPWIDQLVQDGLSGSYALEAFAENNPSVLFTEDPVEMQTWISNLTANDNGIGNYDCPERSLEGIAKLAPFVQDGNMLFFTDDLPKDRLAGTGAAFTALTENKVKIHSILLPKTCNFGSGNDPIGWLAYRFLSLITGGTYQKLTSTEYTDEALAIVLNEMRAQAQLNSKINIFEGISSPNATNEIINYTFSVDETVSKINILLNLLDSTAFYTLTITRPDNTVVLPSDADVTYINSGSAEYYIIENPSIGAWHAKLNGTGEYIFSVSGETPIQFTNLSDARGTPNRPVEIAARLTGPISTVSFEIEHANGQPSAPVLLRDDGRYNDLVAGDGLYTGWYTPTQVTDLYLRALGTTTSGNYYDRTDSRAIRIQAVSVDAVNSIEIHNGEPSQLRFIITNLGASEETYQIGVTSNNDWVTQLPPSQVVIPANSSIQLTLEISVPIDTLPNSTDYVSLTATQESDTTVIAEKGVIVFSTIIEKIYLPTIQRN